jgi:hypothetical protein
MRDQDLFGRTNVATILVVFLEYTQIETYPGSKLIQISIKEYIDANRIGKFETFDITRGAGKRCFQLLKASNPFSGVCSGRTSRAKSIFLMTSLLSVIELMIDSLKELSNFTLFL